jgi:hypothetical protein
VTIDADRVAIDITVAELQGLDEHDDDNPKADTKV